MHRFWRSKCKCDRSKPGAVHLDPAKWAKLVDHFTSPAMVNKSAEMVSERARVRNMSQFGRGGASAAAKRQKQKHGVSPSISEIRDNLPSTGSIPKVQVSPSLATGEHQPGSHTQTESATPISRDTSILDEGRFAKLEKGLLDLASLVTTLIGHTIEKRDTATISAERSHMAVPAVDTAVGPIAGMTSGHLEAKGSSRKRSLTFSNDSRASSREPPFSAHGQVNVVVDSKEQLASKQDVKTKSGTKCTDSQPSDEGDIGTNALNSPLATKRADVNETPHRDPMSKKKGKKSRAPSASPSEALKAAASPNPVAKFVKGDSVNLRNVVDLSIVATGEVNGLPGGDTFHCVPITAPFVRVGITKVCSPEEGLPFISGEDSCLADVLGKNTLWNAKFLRKIS